MPARQRTMNERRTFAMAPGEALDSRMRPNKHFTLKENPLKRSDAGCRLVKRVPRFAYEEVLFASASARLTRFSKDSRFVFRDFTSTQSRAICLSKASI